MKIKILALLVAFLLVASALFVVGTSRAQNPIYYSVEPVATSPLTDTNSSVNGLETPPTPSPVGQNFTVEIHLIGATAANAATGIGGIEVHLNFTDILTYAIPTGFTDFVGKAGGVMNTPLIYALGPGFFDANGTLVSSPPYTSAVEFEEAAASESTSQWNGADALVAKITFEIIKQPNASKGEPTVSFPLAFDFQDLNDMTATEVTHDAIPGTLTIDSTGTVTVPSQYTLTVNTVGTGNVTWNPLSATYMSGTIVTLTATPGTNSTFQSWSGDLTGSQNPVNITMSGNKTVTATFIQASPPGQGFTLTVNVVGNGNVTVYPLNATYASGTIVTLTANPAVNKTVLTDNWYLYQWSGDLAGTQDTINITMNANKTVTATFAKFGDFNNDGKVNLADLVKFASWYKLNSTNPLWIVAVPPWSAPSAADFDLNGKIDLTDLLTLCVCYSSSEHS